VILLLAAAGFAFWIWMIIDRATREPDTGSDKAVWIFIIALTQRRCHSNSDHRSNRN
jgi:hypothetical protein